MRVNPCVRRNWPGLCLLFLVLLTASVVWSSAPLSVPTETDPLTRILAAEPLRLADVDPVAPGLSRPAAPVREATDPDGLPSPEALARFLDGSHFRLTQAAGDEAAARSALDDAYAAEDRGAADAPARFDAVMQRYPATAAGGEAALTVAWLLQQAERFEEAVRLYEQVAAHPGAAVSVTGEAFVHAAAAFFAWHVADRWFDAAGRARGEPSLTMRAELLEEARRRAAQVASTLEAEARRRPADSDLATLAADAWYWAGEALMYQDRDEDAEPAYHRGLALGEGVHPAVRTRLRHALGASLVHQRRETEALVVFQAVRDEPVTGHVLRRIVVSDHYPAQAALWQAVILAERGQYAEAQAAYEACMAQRERLSASKKGLMCLARAADWRARIFGLER